MEISQVFQAQVKQENIETKRFISIHLSNRLLETPLPLHCLFCGELFPLRLYNEPDMVIDTEIKAIDCNPVFDARCRKCKVSWRIYK